MDTRTGRIYDAENLPEETRRRLKMLPVETYVRPGDKVGRNDKCPCMSGRKFKKCCLNKEP